MERYKEFFSGKRTTLMGLGLLGRGVGDARFLAQCGAELLVTDLKPATELRSSLEKLKAFPNITFHLGGHQLEDFRNRDLIIKAAGVPLNSPYVAEAKKNSIPVRMSADLFAQLAGVPIVGVTGTRGKSTVTHLIAHVLKQVGKKVLLGGNVRGTSTLELLSQVTSDTIAVLELDSWQLQGFGEAKMSPNVAVFTNLLADHQNYYQDNSVHILKTRPIFLSIKNQTTI
jgi:UDP-N-acetylmuramoylalanine--D-glutamate ligase